MIKRISYYGCFSFIFCLYVYSSHAQKIVSNPKPLFQDPVFDGAADPVIIWNKKEKQWYMLYTNRRANDTTLKGVTWVHGTRIGIATSKNGVHWKYKDTADIQYRPHENYTHWAPDVVEYNGLYHMFLTYVPGVFTDWNHPREIIHLTSTDLLHWQYLNTPLLASQKVIDACIFPLPNHQGFRMWYNNEKDKKSIYYADSKDLINWIDKGKAVGDKGGEAPKIFEWKNTYWMIVDNWMGMGVYKSTDLLNWKRQENRILEFAGKGNQDQAIGGHCDVVVNNGKAFVYYFTHPGRTGAKNTWKDDTNTRRSIIQLAELTENNGIIECDRNQPTIATLKKPFNK